jgi:DNA mismatch endonuclease (patch repair protein)
MTAKERSERMALVKGKNSKPEMRVRSLVHRLGFRFRLHVSGLPGKPDIVLPRHAKIILVHGCYWHRHGVCRPLSIPDTNPRFWREKFAGNLRRDRANLRQLRRLGWKVLVIWECQTKNIARLQEMLETFLNR